MYILLQKYPTLAGYLDIQYGVTMEAEAETFQK